MSILRPGVLGGAGVAVAGLRTDALARHLEGLGARIAVAPELLGMDEEALGQWASAHRPLDALIVDARGDFAAGGHSGLRAGLDMAWASVREVARELIAAARSGKIVLVGPAPDSGPLAGAARAGLENLARTVSVEWARHGITATAILPGPDTTSDEIAEVVAYLVSSAGDYFSGCCFTLGLA